jgi:hypothetical protein
MESECFQFPRKIHCRQQFVRQDFFCLVNIKKFNIFFWKIKLLVLGRPLLSVPVLRRPISVFREAILYMLGKQTMFSRNVLYRFQILKRLSMVW